MYRKSFRLIFLLFTVGTFRFISMLVDSFTELLLFYCQNNKLAWKWWLYNVCLSFRSFFQISKILSSISFGGRFRISLVPMCKMIYSGLCRSIGFILSCMSQTLVPEKLFPSTLRFQDSRPGCRPERIESPAVQTVPFGHGPSSLLWDVTLSFLSISLIQIGDHQPQPFKKKHWWSAENHKVKESQRIFS